jgi:hypothetical protein
MLGQKSIPPSFPFFFLIYVEACYDEKIMSAECNSVEDGAYVPILVFMEGNE